MSRFLTVLALLFTSLTTPAIAQADRYASFVAKAKGVLTANFKDPDGAAYRNLGVYRQINSKDLSLCGEVNAKNSYGAFVGYVPFFSDENSARLKESSSSFLFDSLRMSYCDKRLASAK